MLETVLPDLRAGTPAKSVWMCASSLCVLLVFFLASCSSVRGKFEKSLNDYNDLLRWHRLEAASAFAGDSISDEFMSRVKAARNMKVFDYRILRTRYNEAKNEAEVQVEIEYYMLSTNRLKSLIDIQKWAYVDENGSRQWRLMSLLPEFE